MESKYKARAEQLYSDIEWIENNVIFKIKDSIIHIMCQLAEEVEKVYRDPLMFGEEGTIQRVYSKAYVEELLQKQRELCASKATINCITEDGATDFCDAESVVDKDSILNAKLKIK